MPNISLPPASTALPVASAATVAGAGSIPGEPAAGADAPPFAALLMKQMAAGLKLQSETVAGEIALPVAASTIPGLEQSDGEILPPDLLALMDAAALTVEGAADNQELTADPAATATPVAIAAPFAAPVAGAQLPPQSIDGTEIGTSAATGDRNRPAATAILAASTDFDGKKLAANVEAGKGFELATTASVPLDQTTAHRGEAVTTPLQTQVVTTTRLDAPVGTRQWDGEVANKVVWMATRNEQRADLVLTPPSLGRVEVSVSVNGDHATAVFTSINPAVREALENAMPRLREAMLEAGINLGQTQVGSESPQQSPERNKNGDNSANAMAATGHESAAASVPQADRFGGARGLVDIFA